MMVNQVGLLVGVIVIVVIAILLIGIILLSRWVVNYANRKNGPDESEQKPILTAREILDYRYAQGEITREQYESMVDDSES
jgi:uncharacterized membrane protein